MLRVFRDRDKERAYVSKTTYKSLQSCIAEITVEQIFMAKYIQVADCLSSRNLN